jgi:hypothetical protein
VRKIHRFIVNGEEFFARGSDILLDAALMNGFMIPAPWLSKCVT